MGRNPTRNTFDPRKKFTRVRTQQGRVQLDADSSEAQTILNYLARHSQARDTLEGIVQWWLLEEKPRVVAARVKKALDELIRAGLVTCTRSASGQACYRLNRRKLSAMLNRLGAQRKRKRRKE
jgi:hypothetical protein